MLSVSSVEENLEDTRETFMEGEEIAYEMAESTVKKKELTMVGVAEDHQSEEEEEEIFLEVTEPSVPGQFTYVSFGVFLLTVKFINK